MKLVIHTYSCGLWKCRGTQASAIEFGKYELTFNKMLERQFIRETLQLLIAKYYGFDY